MTAATDTSPAELLDMACGLVSTKAAVATGVWPRASAFLARQALELAMAQLWDRWGLEMGGVSARAQLLCFEAYAKDEVLAEEVRHAWWALSRASHHHPFELAPTLGELERWFATVARLAAQLDEVATPADDDDVSVD